MQTSVSTKGQIILPAELRASDNIRPGDRFEVEKLKSGEYLLRLIKEKPNEGLVEWLLACPVKGYFKPIPSDSTDSL